MTTSKTLVVVLCETRGAELTANSLERCVLKPLKADLAICVSSKSDLGPYSELASHVWVVEEPEDWASRFDSVFPSKRWRELAQLPKVDQSGLLGGSATPYLSGSGGIIMWFRHFLRACIEEKGLDSQYEWFAILRSDFYWEFEFPDVETLAHDKIHVLNGEKYGGVSDRFMLFPKSEFEKVINIYEDLFCRDSKAFTRMETFSILSFPPNPESYLRFQLERLGVWEKLVWMPYNGWTLREAQGGTRWSVGVWSRLLQVHVKYPEELKRSVVFRVVRSIPLPKKLRQKFQGLVSRNIEVVIRNSPGRLGLFPAIRWALGPKLSVRGRSQLN